MLGQIKKSELVRRPPVVAVMGHVNHGKSTLLDYLRQTKLADKEIGGITQRLGAYEIEIKSQSGLDRLTFLDTPGHEAFQGIRTRGGRAADLAVLVVAADEGVKTQTLEALKVIEEAKIPFIVALNKMDKPDADLPRAKANLAENGIYLEGAGGQIPWLPISAKSGKNIPELLELIDLVAQMEDLRGDPTALAEGVVIESALDSKRGLTATLVIKNGQLRLGQYLAAGRSVAPVRLLENFLGQKISAATFSAPVRIVGWHELPPVGREFRAFSDKQSAEKFAAAGADAAGREKTETATAAAVLSVAVRADSSGALEAVLKELKKLENQNFRFKFLVKGVGLISENDIKLAALENQAIVIGFGVKTDPAAVSLAGRSGVLVRNFEVIYQLTDWLKSDLKNILPKVEKEVLLGRAKILRSFSREKERQVVGGRMLEGAASAGANFRIIRRQSVIGIGKVIELQQRKSKIDEVKSGSEFGALAESKIEIAAGDLLEFFSLVKEAAVI